MEKESSGRIALSENKSKALLKGYGIPVIAEHVAQDARQASEFSEKIGYPVVIKGLGASLLHKTEAGLVHLNLQTPDAIERACETIKKNAGDQLEGFLVQPHLEGKREFVAGLFYDSIFGAVVMFGLGGIFTEALSDVSFRIAPLTAADAGEMIDEIRGKKLLADFRGEKAADRQQLIDTLMGLSELAGNERDVKEVDINPLLVTPEGRVCAVDALVVKGGQATDETSPCQAPYVPVDPRRLGELFYPRSIAFVGASGRMGKWGHSLFTNTLSNGYEGDVYLVNPKRDRIAGRPVYLSVTDIPGDVDLAVITVPAQLVPGLMPDLKAKGIKNMLLITSGFRETGESGRALEEEVVKQARAAGILMVGPNTMGICNPHIKLYCTGTHVWPAPGGISMIAQSGNMGGQLLQFAEQQDIEIRAFSGSGNEAMVTIEDYLEAFEVDALTEIVMLYIESVKNGHRFLESAKRVSMKKPIVLLKGGQTDEGRKAAASHTGAMTSDAKVFDAVCKQSGIVKVDHPMDMLDLSAAFSSLPLPQGNRIGIMTLGGGWGVVASDLCASYQLKIPALSDPLMKRFDELLPPYWSRANPIDLVGENDNSLPLIVLEELMKWDGCDAVINLGILGRRLMTKRVARSAAIDPTYNQEFFDQVIGAMYDFEKQYIEHVVSLMDRYQKPIIGVSIMTDETEDKTLYKVDGSNYKGVFFPTPERAVKALTKMHDYRRFLVR
ncbi:MAG: acetate--CoA ligase family protein [Thermodesulfobacteriota bacterium]|nr:acetate--CoA ligase family protein [Thermodesulfobacteriota bacterium]